MSKTQLVVLRECADSIEAETIRIRLSAADIQSIVTGTDAATALGMGGAGTMRLVRVEVGPEDYERARELLENDRLNLEHAGPWVCSRCGEQNEAAFELCWSCSKPRTDEDQRGRVGHPTESKSPSSPISVKAPLETPKADLNPYRPTRLTGQPMTAHADNLVASEEVTDDVTRCLRAAIVGAFLFPPIIGIYSVYLLLRLQPLAYQDQGLRRRVIVAWCINALSIVGWSLYWRIQFS